MKSAKGRKSSKWNQYLRFKRRNKVIFNIRAWKRMSLTLRYSLAYNSMIHQRNQYLVAVQVPKCLRKIPNLRRRQSSKHLSSSTLRKPVFPSYLKNYSKFPIEFHRKLMNTMIEGWLPSKEFSFFSNTTLYP